MALNEKWDTDRKDYMSGVSEVPILQSRFQDANRKILLGSVYQDYIRRAFTLLEDGKKESTNILKLQKEYIKRLCNSKSSEIQIIDVEPLKQVRTLWGHQAHDVGRALAKCRDENPKGKFSTDSDFDTFIARYNNTFPDNVRDAPLLDMPYGVEQWLTDRLKEKEATDELATKIKSLYEYEPAFLSQLAELAAELHTVFSSSSDPEKAQAWQIKRQELDKKISLWGELLKKENLESLIKTLEVETEVAKFWETYAPKFNKAKVAVQSVDAHMTLYLQIESLARKLASLLKAWDEEVALLKTKSIGDTRIETILKEYEILSAEYDRYVSLSTAKGADPAKLKEIRLKKSVVHFKSLDEAIQKGETDYPEIQKTARPAAEKWWAKRLTNVEKEAKKRLKARQTAQVDLYTEMDTALKDEKYDELTWLLRQESRMDENRLADFRALPSSIQDKLQALEDSIQSERETRLKAISDGVENPENGVSDADKKLITQILSKENWKSAFLGAQLQQEERKRTVKTKAGTMDEIFPTVDFGYRPTPKVTPPMPAVAAAVAAPGKMRVINLAPIARGGTAKKVDTSISSDSTIPARTKTYEALHLPTAPGVFPRNPEQHLGDFDTPAFMLNVNFSTAEVKNILDFCVPAKLAAYITNSGFDKEKIEARFVAQDMPWDSAIPLQLNAHPWLGRADTPNAFELHGETSKTDYRTQKYKVKAGIFSKVPTSIASIALKDADGEGFRKGSISIGHTAKSESEPNWHVAGDPKIRFTGDDFDIDGLDRNKSHLLYSLSMNLDRDSDKILNMVLTEHLLLHQKDVTSFKRDLADSPDLRSLNEKLRVTQYTRGSYPDFEPDDLWF